MNDLFDITMNSYDLRDNKKLVQPHAKPRFMGFAQSDILEPTYGICCPFNVKTVWMFMISENYCLHGTDRIAYVLFACNVYIYMSFYNESNFLCAVSRVRYVMYYIYVL